MRWITCDPEAEVFYYLALISTGMGEIMSQRVFLFLFASLAAVLPEAAWAGSGGPDYVNMGMLAVVIIMLFMVMKKIK